MRLDVKVQNNEFTRRGYTFVLEAKKDSFEVTAIPNGPGPRPFVGDDTGIIRAGTD
jgi:hypothetical protein